MKLFTTNQIASIDHYTIENEPVTDIDLMERASQKMFRYLESELNLQKEIVFLAGPGNNGGDAMALARMFAARDYSCKVFLLNTGKPLKGSPSINRNRLEKQGKAELIIISGEKDFPELKTGTTVVDGLFGSGLTRPPEGLAARLIRHINQSGAVVYAIDLPSGLMGEDNSLNQTGTIIRAKTTLTLQFPKISLLFPENEQYTGNTVVVDIGLHPDAIALTKTPFQMTDKSMVREMLPPRRRFSHKGTFGHALLVAGSYGKMGAAVLAAQSCMRSGTGLVTSHIPDCGIVIMQSTSPETMCIADGHPHLFSRVPPLEKYTAIGAGPGLGIHPDTQRALLELIKLSAVPMVLDADALNILSQNKDWLKSVPANTILTPHPGEFRKLFGETSGSWQRLEKQRSLSRELNVIIVLKGACTATTLPDGQVFFNSTGNPGMATGGSGDVLTGIISGLLAQGLTPENAAVAGVYLHGLAGDLAARKISQPALIASDITKYLGRAYREIYDLRQ